LSATVGPVAIVPTTSYAGDDATDKPRLLGLHGVEQIAGVDQLQRLLADRAEMT
jgi:hypothetical protein